MVFSQAGAAALWEEAAARRWLGDALARAWRAWGYREALAPLWLPAEDVAAGMAGLADEACRFLDPDGRVMSLRPDNTLPMARLAATDLAAEPRPLRLCYVSEVYRRGRGGGWAALPQAGVELVGSGSPEADAEVLALAVQSLLGLGIADFRIAVGHVGLLQEILDAAGVAGAERSAAMLALQDRDYVGLEGVLRAAPGIAAGGREALIRLLTMPAPIDRLGPGRLDRLVAPGRGAAWRDMERTLGLVASYGLDGYVVLEPGLVRDLGYYTGMVFEVSCPGLARPLGGGGRYDRLLGQFGRPEPATGFAFELVELLRALAERGRAGGIPVPAPDWVVVAEPGQGAQAWARARALREEGLVVEVEVMGRSLANTLEYARRRGARRVLLCAADGAREYDPGRPGGGAEA